MSRTRRRDRKKRPARGPAARTPRRRILVVCEGEVTEPEYIEGFRRWCRNPLVEVIVAPEHGVPTTLVGAAVAHKSRSERAAPAARSLGIRLVTHRVGNDYIKMLRHPKHGYG